MPSQIGQFTLYHDSNGLDDSIKNNTYQLKLGEQDYARLTIVLPGKLMTLM